MAARQSWCWHNDFQSQAVSRPTMAAMTVDVETEYYEIGKGERAYGVFSPFSWNEEYEGLLFSIGGDGKAYTVILEARPSGDTYQSNLYFARFATRVGFGRVGNFCSVEYFMNRQVQCFQISIDLFYAFESSNLQGIQLIEIIVLNTMQFRIPFSAFRPVKPKDPPLDPFLVHTLRIQFEPRKQVFYFLAWATFSLSLACSL